LLVAHALAQPKVQGVLYATTRPARMTVPARVLESMPEAEQLTAFAALLDADRPSIPRAVAS
jgi:hypothetical protein